jgi:hypothetical protein
MVTDVEKARSFDTWLWIPEFWLVLYTLLTVVAYVSTILIEHDSYWLVFTIGVPIVIVPATYKNLVGGGCTLRFRICGLVKGILAGLVFVSLSFLADMLVWSFATPVIGWGPPSYDQLGLNPLYIWFIGAVIGGFAARVSEVRGGSRHVGQVKVSSLE